MNTKKPLVLFRAPILTLSGYGTHARQIGDWLLSMEKAGHIELYCDALYWGNTTWIVDRYRDDVVKELMERCRALPRRPDVSVQLQLPNEWDPNLALKNIGVTAAVETDKAPIEWSDACNAMDAVVFPSKHSMDSIVNASKERANQWLQRAFIVPESFSETLLEDADAKILDIERPFTFIVFGQITSLNDARCDRKNTLNTVSWLLEEFAGDDKVGVVVKANHGRFTIFDRYHTENALIAAKKYAASRTNKTLPTLQMLHGDMTDKELVALYKHPNVKALVTATRGEGFGLPILEAAVCELPIIATGWSGHCEYLNKGKFVDLPYTLLPVHESKVDGKIFVKSRWAEVSEKDFKKRVRKFRESSSIPKEWAIDLSQKLRLSHCRKANFECWEAAVGNLIRGI